MPATPPAMSPASEERMLKVIEEVPVTKLEGMLVTMNIMAASGKTEGLIVSGDFTAYWFTNEGEPQIFAVVRGDEDLSDYP